MAGCSNEEDAREPGRCPTDSARARESGWTAPTARELAAVIVDRRRGTEDEDGTGDKDKDKDGVVDDIPPEWPSLNILVPGADVGPAEITSARDNFLAVQGAEGVDRV